MNTAYKASSMMVALQNVDMKTDTACIFYGIYKLVEETVLDKYLQK